MEQKPVASSELAARPENAKTKAVLSLKQIQEDVALQKKYAKAQFRLSVVRTVMAVLMLAAAAVLLFSGVQQVQSTFTRLDAMMDKIEAIDLTGIGQSVEVLKQQGNSLAEETTEKLDAALKQFQEMLGTMEQVDFTALQQSLEDFKALIEPVRAFFAG
jgi:predicted PurR-regulated permease PerM